MTVTTPRLPVRSLPCHVRLNSAWKITCGVARMTRRRRRQQYLPPPSLPPPRRSIAAVSPQRVLVGTPSPRPRSPPRRVPGAERISRRARPEAWAAAARDAPPVPPRGLPPPVGLGLSTSSESRSAWLQARRPRSGISPRRFCCCCEAFSCCSPRRLSIGRLAGCALVSRIWLSSGV